MVRVLRACGAWKQAVDISRLPPNYHTRLDTMNGVDPEALKLALALLLATARRFGEGGLGNVGGGGLVADEGAALWVAVGGGPRAEWSGQEL